LSKLGSSAQMRIAALTARSRPPAA
jgi:hypothetical protein